MAQQAVNQCWIVKAAQQSQSMPYCPDTTATCRPALLCLAGFYFWATHRQSLTVMGL